MNEAPIMQKLIDALLSNDQIELSIDGQWISRCTLAAKPHQENIINIDDLIWLFRVNYIPLNQRKNF